ncbi:MAG: CHAT domain-containing protein [Pseudanabaenaceae cyanobacterium SKYGB_i_bin29]|nr:CHAT domain-containing protein [Pseudanabaenaceae cyanobacterium SKYG29]MDW8420785.1 CHAT domain-containing protein [Pseudanabaenaceae cyanobacterium SKYGB_i_bin29]
MVVTGVPVLGGTLAQARQCLGAIISGLMLTAWGGRVGSQPIVPDGSTSTAVEAGNVVVPTNLNSIRGTNLFHSFDRFHVPLEGVTFSVGTTGINGGRITNIFNRVTGNEPSSILGTIQTAREFPIANFYLLNPNGIVLGSNARLDVGGSFIATTATAVGFSGGGSFTTDRRNTNFFAGSPLTLQFSVEQPGAIINQGQLEVKTGQDIILAGGTVVSPRTLVAPAGKVDVVAVAGNATVTLRAPGSIVGLEVRAGSLAPQWSGKITELPQLAQWLTGASSRPEAQELAVNPDGSLELLPQGRSPGLGTLLLGNGRLEPIGELVVQPGDVILGSIAAADIQAIASNNLAVFVPNIQGRGSVLLQGQNRLLLRDTLETAAVIGAGSNLTFRGDREIDILALNHPTSPMNSGGNITFRSDGKILADGFFTAQGTIGARTVTNNVTGLLSAVEFEEVQGNVRFLPLDQQRRTLTENLLAHRNLDRIARNTTDPVPVAPPPSPPTPAAGDSLTTLAVQASLSSLHLSTATPLPLALDLLLERGKILEAQQTLDLAILGELDRYLGNITPKVNSQVLAQLNPDQQKLYQQYQALQGKEGELGQFLARPDVQRLAQQVREINLQQLQRELDQLDPQAAILYPVLRQDRVEMILIAPGIPPLRRTSYISRAQFLELLQNFRYSLEAIYDVEANPQGQGQALYRHLIQPLEDILEARRIRTLFYVPTAQLRYVPLAALHDGQQWLGQRFRISTITSASLQNFTPRLPSLPRLLAGALTQSQTVNLGGRQFLFAGLPSARGEVNYLTSLVKNSSKLFDQDFSPLAVQGQTRSFNWLHLATHAVFLPGTPADSFIVFGNGERQNFQDLRQWDLGNVDLVVLSACETAAGEVLGNGEEILGFGYLMQERGARTTIASLWSISDGGTQAWMEIFYTLLTSQNLSVAEAVRLTQQILITGDFRPLGEKAQVLQQRLRSHLPPSTLENLSHPYYWAPFLVIGNGL